MYPGFFLHMHSPTASQRTFKSTHSTASTKSARSSSISSLNSSPMHPSPQQQKMQTAHSDQTDKQSDASAEHSSAAAAKQACRSIISDVFDGKLLSSVQCLTCDRISTREETFQDLSLPIPGKDHLSVLHQSQGILSPLPTILTSDPVRIFI